MAGRALAIVARTRLMQTSAYAWARCLRDGGGATAQRPQVLFVRDDIGFASIRDLAILCQSQHTPSDDSWDAWVDWSVLNKYRVLLVSTHGGSPTPRQRRHLAERRSQAKLPPEFVALLTDSGLLRGVLTAFAWITGNTVRAFAPADLGDALRWLTASHTLAEVNSALMQLHEAMRRATQVA